MADNASATSSTPAQTDLSAQVDALLGQIDSAVADLDRRLREDDPDAVLPPANGAAAAHAAHAAPARAESGAHADLATPAENAAPAEATAVDPELEAALDAELAALSAGATHTQPATMQADPSDVITESLNDSNNAAPHDALDEPKPAEPASNLPTTPISVAPETSDPMPGADEGPSHVTAQVDAMMAAATRAASRIGTPAPQTTPSEGPEAAEPPEAAETPEAAKHQLGASADDGLTRPEATRAPLPNDTDAPARAATDVAEAQAARSETAPLETPAAPAPVAVEPTATAPAAVEPAAVDSAADAIAELAPETVDNPAAAGANGGGSSAPEGTSAPDSAASGLEQPHSPTAVAPETEAEETATPPKAPSPAAPDEAGFGSDASPEDTLSGVDVLAELEQRGEGAPIAAAPGAPPPAETGADSGAASPSAGVAALTREEIESLDQQLASTPESQLEDDEPSFDDPVLGVRAPTKPAEPEPKGRETPAETPAPASAEPAKTPGTSAAPAKSSSKAESRSTPDTKAAAPAAAAPPEQPAPKAAKSGVPLGARLRTALHKTSNVAVRAAAVLALPLKGRPPMVRMTVGIAGAGTAFWAVVLWGMVLFGRTPKDPPVPHDAPQIHHHDKVTYADPILLPKPGDKKAAPKDDHGGGHDAPKADAHGAAPKADAHGGGH